jgi:hypothetical protein
MYLRGVRIIHSFTKNMMLSRNHFKMIACLVLSIVVLFVCTFEPLSNSSDSHSNNTFCGSACQPHTQAERIIKSGGLVVDEKEPIPPFTNWVATPQNLLLLYISSLFILIYFLWNKKLFIRNSNLRF